MPTRSQIEFIKMTRGVDAPSSKDAVAWIREGLWEHIGRQRAGDPGRAITPRGEDLIASAASLTLVDLDSLTPDDEQVIDASFEVELADCPDCEGGRIPVIVGSSPVAGPSTSDYTVRVWDMGCTTCGGRGKRLTDATGIDPAILRVYPTLGPDAQRTVRTPVEMRAALLLAESEGLEVEVTWDRKKHHRSDMQSTHSGRVRWGGHGYPQIGHQLFDDVGRGTTIPELTSVKILRPTLDPWAREPEAITALLREAQETGREVEAESDRGEVSGEVLLMDGTSVPALIKGMGWCALIGSGYVPTCGRGCPTITAVRFKATP